MSGNTGFEERLKRIGAQDAIRRPVDGTIPAPVQRRRSVQASGLSLLGVSPAAIAAVGFVLLGIYGIGALPAPSDGAAKQAAVSAPSGDIFNVNKNWTRSAEQRARDKAELDANPYVQKIRANAEKRRFATETDRRAAAYSGQGGAFNFPDSAFDGYVDENGQFTDLTQGYIKQVQGQ